MRWHVQQAEAYIKALSGRRLATHTAQDIERYLQDKGRNFRLKDWQFQQVVTALQVLFVELVKAAWAPAFPWGVWRTNARDLPATHATVARDYDTCLLGAVEYGEFDEVGGGVGGFGGGVDGGLVFCSC